MYAQEVGAQARHLPLLEQIAEDDARVDHRHHQPSEYHEFAELARTGVISAEAWQCYQAAYMATRFGELAPIKMRRR